MSKRIQFIQETISSSDNANKTEYNTSFLQNYQSIEVLDKVINSTRSQFMNLLQPTLAGKNAQFSSSQFSKLTAAVTGGKLVSNKEWCNSETSLATFLAEQAGEIDNFMDNCAFSLGLMDAAKTYRYIGDARNDLGKNTEKMHKNTEKMYKNTKKLHKNTKNYLKPPNTLKTPFLLTFYFRKREISKKNVLKYN